VAFDMEVGLGPSHIVLDGDPAPLPKKRTEPTGTPNFRPIFIVAKRLGGSRCHTWYGGIGLSPGDFVLDGDPA